MMEYFMFGSQTGSYFSCQRKENKSSFPGSHKQKHTQDAEGQVGLWWQGNRFTHIQGDNILQIVLKTDHKCSAVGSQGPKKRPLSICRPEIWGQNSNRIHGAHKMQEEKKYSPNTSG